MVVRNVGRSMEACTPPARQAIDPASRQTGGGPTRLGEGPSTCLSQRRAQACGASSDHGRLFPRKQCADGGCPQRVRRRATGAYPCSTAHCWAACGGIRAVCTTRAAREACCTAGAGAHGRNTAAAYAPRRQGAPGTEYDQLRDSQPRRVGKYALRCREWAVHLHSTVRVRS